MLKILSFLQGEQRADTRDARLVYKKIMKQSRKPSFYGNDLFADSYDGRMEVLCMHLSIVLNGLRKFDKNGERLSQAIYDVMIDDFDTALREEGLSDTGVSRRIKPLAKMFFSRAKTYAELLSDDKEKHTELETQIQNFLSLSHGKDKQADNINHAIIVRYTEKFNQIIGEANLSEIAQASFSFPEVS